MRNFALALISYVATATVLTNMSKVKNAAEAKCGDCHRYPSPEKLLAEIDLEA